jgi:hypothetical protein
MNILELFAEKYLSNYDVELPLNNGIISNGHCYHHALEYANGDLTVAFSNDLNKNADIKECILASRVDITDLYIGLLTYLFENRFPSFEYALSIERNIKKRRELEDTINGYRIEIKSMNEFKKNTAYSEDKIIKQGVIFKQKALCILMPYKNQPDKLTFRILTNDDIGTRFNVNNILFLINLSNTKKDKKSGKLYPIGEHFITFRNSKCRRLIPSRDFIDIINYIILNGVGLNGQPILRIDADIDGIMEINFNIQDIDVDRQIIGDRRLIKLKLLPEIMPVVLPEEPETNSVRNAIKQVATYKRQQSENNNISPLSNNSGLNLDNKTPTSSVRNAVIQVEKYKRQQSENNLGLNLDNKTPTSSVRNAVIQVEKYKRQQSENNNISPLSNSSGLNLDIETPENRRLRTLKNKVKQRRQYARERFFPKQGTPLNARIGQTKKTRNITL